MAMHVSNAQIRVSSITQNPFPAFYYTHKSFCMQEQLDIFGELILDSVYVDWI